MISLGDTLITLNHWIFCCVHFIMGDFSISSFTSSFISIDSQIISNYHYPRIASKKYRLPSGCAVFCVCLPIIICFFYELWLWLLVVKLKLNKTLNEKMILALLELTGFHKPKFKLDLDLKVFRAIERMIDALHLRMNCFKTSHFSHFVNKMQWKSGLINERMPNLKVFNQLIFLVSL